MPSFQSTFSPRYRFSDVPYSLGGGSSLTNKLVKGTGGWVTTLKYLAFFLDRCVNFLGSEDVGFCSSFICLYFNSLVYYILSVFLLFTSLLRIFFLRLILNCLSVLFFRLYLLIKLNFVPLFKTTEYL